MTEALSALASNEVDVWLDDLSRERLDSGNLQELIDTRKVTGVTTNPTIFEAAITKGRQYDDSEREDPADYHLMIDSTALALDTVVDIVAASMARRRQAASSGQR